MKDTKYRPLNIRWIAGLACTMGFFSIVCSPAVEGELGQLKLNFMSHTDIEGLAYHPAAGVLNGQNLLAGGKVDFVVEDGEGHTAHSLTSLEKDNESFVVEDRSGGSFILRAQEAGSLRIEIGAEFGDGESIDDAFSFTASEPDRLALRHACESPGDERHAFYLVGSDIRLGYAFYLGDVALVGYGFYPIAFDGDAQVSLNEESRDLYNWFATVGNQAGVATLSNEIDESEFIFEVVEADAIDDARLLRHAELRELEPGQSSSAAVIPSIQGSDLCFAAVDFTIDNRTPEICEMDFAGDESSFAAPYQKGAVRFTRHTAGDCEVEVIFPGATEEDDVAVPFAI